MTDALLRRGEYTLAPVQRRDLEPAFELCQADPVANVVPLAHIETAMKSGIIPSGLWAVRSSGPHGRRVQGVVWSGANLTAVLATDADDEDDARAELAAAIVTRLTRPAAIVGQSQLTLDLWGRIEPWWGPARQVRERQVSMAASMSPPEGESPRVDVEGLRRATLADYDALLPAAVHMFIGEVGYDPMLHGREAYEDRLQHLVRQGRSYVQYGTVDGSRTVVFKADVGVVGGQVAQVQGVWTHPGVRGNGVGRAGMASLIRQVRADHAPTVSLYVNDFNQAALRTYRAVGFRHVGEFATVMF